jgi:hypothetical protein
MIEHIEIEFGCDALLIVVSGYQNRYRLGQINANQQPAVAPRSECICPSICKACCVSKLPIEEPG